MSGSNLKVIDCVSLIFVVIILRVSVCVSVCLSIMYVSSRKDVEMGDRE